MNKSRKERPTVITMANSSLTVKKKVLFLEAKRGGGK
jgi:hypothetical protein